MIFWRMRDSASTSPVWISLVLFCLSGMEHCRGWKPSTIKSFPRPLEVAPTSTRREVLRGVAARLFGVTIASLKDPMQARAVEEETLTGRPQKPFAPIDKLLPAVRVKWTIEKATAIVLSMDDSSSTDWTELRDLLLFPQNYTSGELPDVPTAPAKAYLDTYKRNRQKMSLLAQPGAILAESGEISSWRRLKQQERRKEEEDEIRAALNVYTSALSYSPDSYMLNVPTLVRKQMIRQDRLPDVKQVIQSDMGMRYLYRNELLTTVQEARAELEYQLSQETPSKNELVELLQISLAVCDQWFYFIDEQEIKKAVAIVQKENDGH